MKLSLKMSAVLSIAFVLFSFQPGFSTDTDGSLKEETSVNQILDDLEKRFSGSGFSADFYQESPLPDIGITESATGKAFFKKPEKFRWEYQQPDSLHYISDGKSLWIHSPEDNNVWVGEASSFFGKESSASFLTDISLIREKFTVKRAETTNEKDWELILLPTGSQTFGVNKIFLSIDKKTGNISKLISFNTGNTETKVILSNYKFNAPAEELFNFKIPKNAMIIPLE